MEDTLRVKAGILNMVQSYSLNPCFNGRYSQRKKVRVEDPKNLVLILVLMEDTLRVRTKKHA